jgi:hypothetical protein
MGAAAVDVNRGGVWIWEEMVEAALWVVVVGC